MKKEEAIRRIKEFGLYHAIGDLPNSAKTVEAFNMAIEALKQAPKPGKWIDTEAQDYIEVKHRICSVCYREPAAWSNHKKFKYCPNCGARMESEQ